ncbi:adenosine deaminase [Xenophilus sp. AP218F]|nr:adenosine deaminase [Chromobacterium sp. ASV5]OWY38204.1 adenosine deaminase [Xenophilus sp. AP218F]
MKLSLLPIAAALALSLTGCASILNDQTQQVNVSSTTGSDIKGTVDGKPFKGPGIVELKRENKNKIFMTETEGCASQTVVEKSVDPKFFVNILSGGAFGSTTDYSTEKMWKYSENVVVSCKK